MATEAAQYLEVYIVYQCYLLLYSNLIVHFDFSNVKQIVPPVIDSFTDQDSRVRYYACEALYNIAKVKTIVLNIPCRFGFIICAVCHWCTMWVYYRLWEGSSFCSSIRFLMLYANSRLILMPMSKVLLIFWIASLRYG